MTSPRSLRRGPPEISRRGKVGDTSTPFNGEIPAAGQIRGTRTLPDIYSYVTSSTATSPDVLYRRPTKLLIKVTVIGSLGSVPLVMSPDSTVGDLVSAAAKQYAEEGRRPILPTTDPSAFDLHYSQFSLESLDKEEKVMELGSRNFLMCPKRAKAMDGGNHGGLKQPMGSCCLQADTATKTGFDWLKFML